MSLDGRSMASLADCISNRGFPISIEPDELANLIDGTDALFEAHGGSTTVLPIERRFVDVEGVHMESISLTDEAIRSADCVVITTDHKSYDWHWVVENSALVVDTRNATRGVALRSSRVVML